MEVQKTRRVICTGISHHQLHTPERMEVFLPPFPTSHLRRLCILESVSCILELRSHQV